MNPITVHMWSGDFQVIPQMTLGDMLTSTVLFLILAFMVIKWLANEFWGS